jgi:hypothetical protein
MEVIVDIVKQRGYVWRNPDEMEKHMPQLCGQYVYQYEGTDYFDLRVADGDSQRSREEHLHPSILVLARDPYKAIPI